MLLGLERVFDDFWEGAPIKKRVQKSAQKC